MIDKKELKTLNTLMGKELNTKQYENLIYAFIWKSFLDILDRNIENYNDDILSSNLEEDDTEFSKKQELFLDDIENFINETNSVNDMSYSLNIPLLGTLTLKFKKDEENKYVIDKSTINFDLDNYFKFNLQCIKNKEIPYLLQEQFENKLKKMLLNKL